MTEATLFPARGNRLLLAGMVGLVFLILSGIPFTFFSSISGTLTGNSIFSSESTGSGVVQWLQQSSGSLLPYLLGTVGFILILLLTFLLRHLLQKKTVGLPMPEKPLLLSQPVAEKSAQPFRIAPPLQRASMLKKVPLKRWQGKAAVPLDEELAFINQKLAVLGEESPRLPVFVKPSEPLKKVVSLPPLPRPIPETRVPLREEPRAKKHPLAPDLSLQPLTEELAVLEKEFKRVEKATMERPKLRTIVPATEGQALPLTGTEKKIVQQTPRRFGSFFHIPEKLLPPLFRQQERSPVQRAEIEKAPPPRALPIQKGQIKAKQKWEEAPEKEDRKKTPPKKEKNQQLVKKQQALSDIDAVAEEIKTLLRKDFA